MKRIACLLALVACGEEPDGNPFGAPGGVGWLQGEVYYIDPGSERIPDVSGMSATAIVFTSTLDITPRVFTRGFIEPRFEWFAIRYRGTFEVQKNGEYVFRMLSDDGANLYVDGVKVIDNDGLHPPVEKIGDVKLLAGPHRLQVDYFQGPRYEIALRVWVTPPRGVEALLAESF